jgi:hypothetical protein
MSFTFTPSAYIDPRLDYIHVTLENGLWRGRFWLPHEQRLEIRREIPELDLPFGTVIRTRMRIGDYAFNRPVPEWLFASRLPVTMVAREERERFAFERPIDDEWRLEGLDRPLGMEEVRRQAREAIRQQVALGERTLTGLPRTRASIGTASDVFRYNRAEGLVLGGGWSIRGLEGTALRAHAGWAFGPGHPVLRGSVTWPDPVRATLGVHLNRRGDVGGPRTSSGAANTLGALLFADDPSDPYYASGAELTLETDAAPGWTARLVPRLERHTSAAATATYSLFGDPADLRPVRPIDDGTLAQLGLGLRRDARSPAGGSWVDGRLSAGRLTADSGPALPFASAELEGGIAWSASARRLRVEIDGQAGAAIGDIPRQRLYLLGGRGTLPGIDHRSLAGDRFALARGVASADLFHPWARGRVLGSLGVVGRGEAGRDAVARWAEEATVGWRGSVGVGVGLFYDLLRIDLGRGIGPGGRTGIIIEFQPDFWDFL